MLRKLLLSLVAVVIVGGTLAFDARPATAQPFVRVYGPNVGVYGGGYYRPYGRPYYAGYRRAYRPYAAPYYRAYRPYYYRGW